eukprot:740349_1
MFTNPADAATGDRGCHVVEGTSGCDLMVVSIPSQEGSAVMYCGPTAAHYEVITELGTPINGDAHWRQLLASRAVPRPSWTRDYTVCADSANVYAERGEG